MPNLKDIQSAVIEIATGPPLVVVLTGGTTGIGSYVATNLAKAFANNGPKLRVYIVGRNAVRAKDVTATGEKLSPGSDWRFVQATDLALISEVDRSCTEIIRQETTTPLHDAPTTGEGLDAFLSTTYYSRIRFILKLQQLLTAAPLPGHVISIYAEGFEDGTKPGESPIGLPPPATYGVAGVRKHTCFMKNFVFEELAERHAGKLSLTHIYPGLVDGPGFYNPEMPAWFRFIWRLLKSLASLYMTSPKDCGDVMLYLATPRFPAKSSTNEVDTGLTGRLELAKSTLGEFGGGSYAVGQRGDVATKGVSYEKVRQQGTNNEVLDHTMETLARIERENANASST